ncbi:MAG: hypothetical protein N2484_10235 [Clostridia bacterium]|nr:hypothetical protein [Clostridia bacterium]
MADFCTCGSIMLNGHCTNKNCSNKSPGKAASPKASSSKASKNTDPTKAAKPAKTRRASKCIVYNLYDKKEENID